jgi:hypothetical protein
MISQIHSVFKRTSLFVLLASMLTQPLHGKGEIVGKMLDAFATAAVVSGSIVVAVGGVSAYKMIRNFVNRPSQADCEQVFEDAKKLINEGEGTVEFFEKLTQCTKLYGNQKNTLKYTDEKK